jgi:hypothetical protein
LRFLTISRLLAVVFFAVLCFSLAGCAGGASSSTTPAPTPTPTPGPGPNPTPTPSPTPGPGPNPSPTPTPTPGPSGQSVTLSWSASSSSGVVSYNVYRSSASTGPFTRIGNVTSTSYTDASVAAGQTYFYTVTSVNGNNVESAEATPVSATVPSS